MLGSYFKLQSCQSAAAAIVEMLSKSGAAVVRVEGFKFVAMDEMLLLLLLWLLL